jgi:hypothetical protein
MLDIAFEKVCRETPNGTLCDWANAHPNMAEEEAIMRACMREKSSKAGRRWS